MSNIVLEAFTRADLGKGASRRLRRLENKVPAIVYGGEKEPVPVFLFHNKIVKALENESIYSSVFELNIDGKSHKVILKAVQRHPFKPVILHMDMQRVSAKDILVKMVPIHFINEETCKGVKAGGMINRSCNQVEIRCQASKLPEFIEVDLAKMAVNDVLHLSDLKLPKDVTLVADISVAEHNAPVVSIHLPRASAAEEETAKPVEPEADAAAETSEE